MTNTIAIAQLKAANSYLEREMSSALLNALTAVLGEGLATTEKAEPKTLAQDCFCLVQNLDRPETGSVAFSFRRTSAFKLGEELLKARSLDQTDEEQAITAVKELVAQAGTSLAKSLSVRLKREVRGADLAEQSTPVLPEHSIAIKLTIKSEALEVIAWASPELLEALALADDSTQAAMVPVTAVAARNLDLLLDVEMPVSISFGRAQLPLKDVFRLTIGSMVELNRAISEPVEVIVNNSVIAQGEVVVVEGNFGVRITHVMSKHDRIRSLT